jgi:hypothetical protein
MQWKMLCSSHTEVSLEFYSFIILVDMQFNFLAAQRMMFRKDVPITDAEVRSMMKQWLLPTSP